MDRPISEEGDLTLADTIAAPEEAPYREGATGPRADAYRVVFAGLEPQEQALIQRRLEQQLT